MIAVGDGETSSHVSRSPVRTWGVTLCDVLETCQRSEYLLASIPYRSCMEDTESPCKPSVFTGTPIHFRAVCSPIVNRSQTHVGAMEGPRGLTPQISEPLY